MQRQITEQRKDFTCGMLVSLDTYFTALEIAMSTSTHRE